MLLFVASLAVADNCVLPDYLKQDCGGGGEQGCKSRQCCWKPAANATAGTPWCFYPAKCEIPDTLRKDCGYPGINENECVLRGCCWKPLDHPGPWCYNQYTGPPVPVPAAAPVPPVAPPTADGPPYSESEFELIVSYFSANLDVQASGAVVASPSTANPDYYYHWMRDAGLSMLTDFKIHHNDTDTAWVTRMVDYMRWEGRAQHVADPNAGQDVRGEPKFYIPGGAVYDQGWCRPQNDGAGLRTGTLVLFALTPAGASYAQQILSQVETDMNYISGAWQQETCDLWEEIRSTSIFWNNMVHRRAALLAAHLADSQGRSDLAATWRSLAQQIQTEAASHWDGNVIFEAKERPYDSAVLCAINDMYLDDGFYSPVDEKVWSTVQHLTDWFRSEYSINPKDDALGLPGVLLGRYPHDLYFSGNPWILTSQCLGELCTVLVLRTS